MCNFNLSYPNNLTTQQLLSPTLFLCTEKGNKPYSEGKKEQRRKEKEKGENKKRNK